MYFEHFIISASCAQRLLCLQEIYRKSLLLTSLRAVWLSIPPSPLRPRVSWPPPHYGKKVTQDETCLFLCLPGSPRIHLQPDQSFPFILESQTLFYREIFYIHMFYFSLILNLMGSQYPTFWYHVMPGHWYTSQKTSPLSFKYFLWPTTFPSPPDPF